MIETTKLKNTEAEESLKEAEFELKVDLRTLMQKESIDQKLLHLYFPSQKIFIKACP